MSTYCFSDVQLYRVQKNQRLWDGHRIVLIDLAFTRFIIKGVVRLESPPDVNFNSVINILKFIEFGDSISFYEITNEIYKDV